MKVLALLSVWWMGAPGGKLAFPVYSPSTYYPVVLEVIDQVADSEVAWSFCPDSDYFSVVWTLDGWGTWFKVDSFNYKVDENSQASSSTVALVGHRPALSWMERLYYPAFGYAVENDSAVGLVSSDSLAFYPHFRIVGILDTLLVGFYTTPDWSLSAVVYSVASNRILAISESIVDSFMLTTVDYDPYSKEIYVFGTHLAEGLCYYKISWNGSGFSAQGPYTFAPVPTIDLGNGYVLDAIVGEYGVLAFNGTEPIPLYLVGLSALYSQHDTLEKALVLITEDTSYVVVKLTSDPADFLYFGQLVTDHAGHVLVVYERMTVPDESVGWGWWDIYGALGSVGDLSRWEIYPIIVTDDQNEGLVHAPKHCGSDSSYPRVCITYLVDTGNTDLYYYIWHDGGPLLLSGILTCVNVLLSVEESASTPRPSYRFDGRELHFVGLPAGTVLRVYDITGRVVKEVKLTSSRVSLADLGSGAYFFRAGKLAGKVVVK